MKKIFGLFLTIGFFLCLPFSVQATERITDFDSKITINNDGTITVVETIKAMVEHQQINHGIYRDLIIKYPGPDDNHYYLADIDILSIKRNGIKEPYHTKINGLTLRIYIGDSDKLVPLGEHTYELTYRASGLMRYFSEFDELYWNVTGNNWAFPIERARAQVNLPWQATTYPDFYSYGDFYTGANGEKGKDGVWGLADDNIVFDSGGIIYPGEGLTVVVGFPNGRIAKLLPTLKEVDFFTRFMNSLNQRDRINLTAIMAIIVLIYFSLVWLIRGRDPRRGTIIPRYEPPSELSPADIAHVVNLGFGFKESLGAVIISLAIKKKIKISRPEGWLSSGKWQFDRLTEDLTDLTSDEKLLFNNLFNGTNKIIVPNYDKDLGFFINHNFKNHFRKKWNKVVYIENLFWLIIGIVLSLMTFLVYLTFDGFYTIFLLVFILFPLIILFSIALSIKKSITKRDGFFAVIGSVFSAMIFFGIIVFFGISFWPVIIKVFSLDKLYWLELFKIHWNLIPFSFILFTNILAFKYIRRPTLEGRRLLDEIEGFKLFLVTTEKDRMEFFHPIKQVPEIFEKYFPYALALGVADKWVARFDNLFQENNGQINYTPVWYSGSISGISSISNISSIGNSLGSSLTSSGAGGGGGSGGGGGGGGGGGW